MTTKSSSRSLPDFDNPPVVETLLDVSFEPLWSWHAAHFGSYWERIRREYPDIEDQPPVMLERELFGEEKGQRRAEIFPFHPSQPPVRCWFVSESKSRLIQVQIDRFIHNWRKHPDNATEKYPHYEEVIRPEFEIEWSRFCHFLKEESIGEPQVQQCEVRYINHIELSEGWQTYLNVVRSLDSWPGSEVNGFLPTPEDLQATISYLMPNNKGRLRIIVEPGIRNLDAKPVLQLSLVARGRPASSMTADILEWFDLGREWIVRGFTDFTTEKMHTIWHRRV